MARPPQMNGGDAFDGILDTLARAAEAEDRLTLGQILAAIGTRGFGPLLVILALFLILPVGLVPGMPGAVAVVLALIAVEILTGGRALHLPRRLRGRTLRSALVLGFVRRVRPWTRWLHRLLHPRLVPLAASRAGLAAVAVTILGVAAVIFVAGVIPGLPFLLAFPVLLFGLGLTAHDGLAVALGYALILPLVGIALHLF
ncbi:MAG: exopolysaccharide biosynthesis protein [Rhodobacterales bacterium]|nr:exopolysaccharide biosynthesis protein [Rhodobacterales bacterium]